MVAVCKFERDTMVARLQVGLQAKRLTTNRTAQDGALEAQGRRSLLESVKPTRLHILRLQTEIAKREDGKFGLAKQAQSTLRLAIAPTLEVVLWLALDLQK